MFKGPLKLILLIYKKAVSPALPPSCRFYPSCSDYAFEAIDAHGPTKGVFLAVKRLLRCHPFNPGGFDPVPHQEHTKLKGMAS